MANKPIHHRLSELENKDWLTPLEAREYIHAVTGKCKNASDLCNFANYYGIETKKAEGLNRTRVYSMDSIGQALAMRAIGRV